MRGRIRASQLVLLGALGVIATPVGWVASDALERNNDFCNACHIEQDVPLHIDIRRDFDARPARSLAGLHAEAMPAARPDDPQMRCIDCHGGTGLVGRAHIKWLAAQDLMVWLSGRAKEPGEMRHPLLDADCRKCHSEYSPRRDALAPPAFHELAVHNMELGMACVECHLSHEQGGNAAFYQLHSQQVRARCAHCHSEFEG